MADDTQNQNQAASADSGAVQDIPVDVVAAGKQMAETVAGQGFDTYPNQFAEENARARELAQAAADGARDGAAAAEVEHQQQVEGVSALREKARIENARRYQAEFDKAKASRAADLQKQAQAVKDAVANPQDRPA